MRISQLEKLQRHANGNHRLQSIFRRAVTVVMETTLHNSSIKQLLSIQSVINILNRWQQPNENKRLHDSHLIKLFNCSQSFNTPDREVFPQSILYISLN